MPLNIGYIQFLKQDLFSLEDNSIEKNKYLRYKKYKINSIKRHSVVEMSNTINKLW